MNRIGSGWGLLLCCVLLTSCMGHSADNPEYPRPDMEAIGPAADWEIRGPTVSTLYGNTLVIDNGGGVWAWGWNTTYQAGAGHNQVQPEPVKVMDGAAAVRAAPNHSMVIRTDGSLWTWGDNYMGKLGTGELEPEIVPYPTKVMEGVAFVGPSIQTTVVIDKENRLYMCGRNEYGQLGDGGTRDKPTFQLVMEDVRYAQEHGRTAALKTNREVWCWGCTANSAVGNGTTLDDADVLIPDKVLEGAKWLYAPNWATYAIREDDSLWYWGAHSGGKHGQAAKKEVLKFYDMLYPVKVMDDVKEAYNGSNHALALKTDCTLWGWGSNQLGQIGDGKGGKRVYQFAPVQIMENVRAAAVDHSSCFAIDQDDNLWAWGENLNGTLGIGHTEVQYEPAFVTDGVHSVYAANSTTLILKWDGTLWGCGPNSDGGLGDGTTKPRDKPVLVMENVKLPEGAE